MIINQNKQIEKVQKTKINEEILKNIDSKVYEL